MSDTAKLVETVKKCLKSQDITYASLAKKLGMTEAGVKRMFSKESLTLDRLEEICSIMNVGLLDLAAIAQRSEKPLISELTDEQEDALAIDPELLMVFYRVINGWSKEDLAQGAQLGERKIDKLLLELDRLGLIELHPLGRVKLLTVPHIRWRHNGPIHKKYEQSAMNEFLNSKFDGDEISFNFFFYQFSQSTIRHLKNRIERLNSEVLAFAESDALLPPSQKQDVGLLMAMRPWLFSALASTKSGRKR